MKEPRCLQKYVGVPYQGNSSDESDLQLVFCFTARGKIKRMWLTAVHISAALDGSGQLDVVESRTFSVHQTLRKLDKTKINIYNKYDEQAKRGDNILSVKQTEKAKAFIKRRLAGDSVTDIARDMNVTRQSIYFFFSGFPKPTLGEDQVLFSVSEDMAFRICMFYYSCLPKRGKKEREHWDEIMENAVRQTAEMFLLSEAEVRSVLCRLTEYHFPVKSTPHYNAIESWRRQENISLTELARISGCGKQQLRSILRGEQPLPERNAKLIAKHSGLSENDIYADIIRVECYQKPENSGGVENA